MYLDLATKICYDKRPAECANCIQPSGRCLSYTEAGSCTQCVDPSYMKLRANCKEENVYSDCVAPSRCLYTAVTTTEIVTEEPTEVVAASAEVENTEVCYKSIVRDECRKLQHNCGCYVP